MSASEIHVWYQPLSGTYAAGLAAPHPKLPGIMRATGKVHDVTDDIHRLVASLDDAAFAALVAGREMT